MFYCTCCLCFPLVQQHYPLTCTEHRMSLCPTCDALWSGICACTASHPLSTICYPLKIVCSLCFYKGNVMSTSLPSEWPGLLAVGLCVGPSRDCPWTAHKRQSRPECGGQCEELISSLSLCPLCHSLCPSLAGWSWCCTPGMWRWACQTCEGTGRGVWDVTRCQRQCEHLGNLSWILRWEMSALWCAEKAWLGLLCCSLPCMEGTVYYVAFTNWK